MISFRPRGKRIALQITVVTEWLYLKRSSGNHPLVAIQRSRKNISSLIRGSFFEAVSEILVEQFSYRLIHERLSPKQKVDGPSVLHSILNYTTKQNPLAKPGYRTPCTVTEKNVCADLGEGNRKGLLGISLQTWIRKFGVLLALLDMDCGSEKYVL